MYRQLVAVTNRSFCIREGEEFLPGSRAWKRYLEQVERIADRNPAWIVLREKDLDEELYSALAREVISLCRNRKQELFPHSFCNSAVELGWKQIHLPLGLFREIGKGEFERVGTSVHSLEDATLAVELGADYLFAGNIFETDCKKGLPGRGLDFLREICEFSPVPVYGIGGIDEQKLPLLLEAGAAGGCMMSGFMKLPELFE